MGTKFQGTEEEMITLNAYIALLRSTETLTSKLNYFLSKNHLTVSQFGVMECLYYLGPMCQKEISTKILKSTANMTTVIDNLEKLDFVQRIRQENDRRFISVCLTEKGKATIQTILPGHIQEIFKLFSALNTEEKRNLFAICKKLGLANKDE
jgi:MarR family transcriptional regulator, 2-MHQ and catechol-resistance regulon repressor